MMHLKFFNITSALALATTFFAACSEENHAGVLTETESGTTIASIEGSVTNEKGKPVASAKVSLISADHIAARMAPIKTATTDKSGKYTIDSVSAGDYALQIRNTEHTQSGYQTITVEDDKTDTQKLKPATSLEENASLKLKLSAYSLDKGDTLCITGTLNCIAIDDKSAKAGTVTIDEIPPMEFTNITLIRKADSKATAQDVQWDFVPGETLEVSAIQIPIVISKDVMKQAKLLNDKTTLDSMIVPVTLSTGLQNPILLSDKGDTLPLYKVENDKNNSKYLTVIPNIDVGTYTFTVASSESVIRPTQIKKASGVTEPGMRITNSESWQAFGNVLGISFWVTKDSLSSAKDSVYVDTREKESDVAFSIKAGPKSDELCAEFYKRDSTDSDDTISYYTRKDSSCHKVLDGERHHYSIFIQKHHVVIAIDGRVVDTKDFSDQFQTIPPITIGNHKLENLVIYTLGDSITQSDKGWDLLHAWLSAFYTLQK